MITAILLCTVNRQHIPETAQALLEIPEVSEVYSVAGDYDLVAIVRVRKHEDLAEVVTARLASLDAIMRTNTLIAFRAFSHHDLERLFSIGSEDEAL
ncbi:MAG TPA: Lrp/AsnC ligand binding domain-containing protein [Chloroflexota bacterium]|jgi:DNA-binding Lrp family transcriptional regulator|nr:Lrp/AsnC ligand binding domain-containing protein [Chloroflexota bacterium]